MAEELAVLPGVDTIPADQAVTVTDTPQTVFGFNAVNLKTPENVRNFFDKFLIVATIANIVVAGFPQIPLQAKLYISEGSAVLILIVKQIESMYGVVDTPKTNP